MATQCTARQLEFEGLGRRRIVARFDGGRMTSDGRALLLREADRLFRNTGEFPQQRAALGEAEFGGRHAHHAQDTRRQRLSLQAERPVARAEAVVAGLAVIARIRVNGPSAVVMVRGRRRAAGELRRRRDRH